MRQGKVRSEPIFKSIFGKDWNSLPLIIQKHYANRPFSNEQVKAEGVMSVESSLLGRLLTPLFRLVGALVPYEGRGVPVTVIFFSDPKSDVFQFDRTFHFPNRKPCRFLSRMKPIGGNELVEFMRFGLGWRMAYNWTGKKVTLTHRGYVLNLFGRLWSLPLEFVLGRGYAEEVPINQTEFSMKMEVRHKFWGKVYGYSGTFAILDLLTSDGEREVLKDKIMNLFKTEAVEKDDAERINCLVHGFFNFDGVKGAACDRDGYLLHYCFKDSSSSSGVTYVESKDIPLYATSLVVQEKILPQGWYVEKFKEDTKNGKFKAVLSKKEGSSSVVSALLPTKELAALHACLLVVGIDND